MPRALSLGRLWFGPPSHSSPNALNTTQPSYTPVSPLQRGNVVRYYPLYVPRNPSALLASTVVSMLILATHPRSLSSGSGYRMMKVCAPSPPHILYPKKRTEVPFVWRSPPLCVQSQNWAQNAGQGYRPDDFQWRLTWRMRADALNSEFARRHTRVLRKNGRRREGHLSRDIVFPTRDKILLRPHSVRGTPSRLARPLDVSHLFVRFAHNGTT